MIIKDYDCGDYEEDTLLSLWKIFHSRSTTEESALWERREVPACAEGGLAEGKDEERSGLSGESEAESGGLVEQESQLLEAIPCGAS
jgi:hypothetical protein